MKARFLLDLGYAQFLIGEGDAPPPGTPPAPPPPPAPRVYTQDELNDIVKKERKQYEEKLATQIANAETLARSAGLTEQERKKALEHVDQLKNELLSKEELAAKERKRLAEEHETTLKGVTSERDTWKLNFEVEKVSTDIAKASNKYKAVAVEQMEAQLKPWTAVVAETDKDGKPTGKHVARVRFPTVDKNQAPITLELSVDAAVKLMSETPERFGNLFESGLKGGLGMGGGSVNRTAKDIKDMDPGEYRRLRREEEKNNPRGSHASS